MVMIKNLVLATVVMAVAVVGMPTKASAAPILSIAPVFQSGDIGDTFTVDINVLGLAGEEVGSFDLDIAFSNLILLGQSFVLGSGLGDPNNFTETMDLSGGFSGGIIDLAEVSLLAASDLLALQGGNAFTLATLTFRGLSSGVSPLTITQAIFADGDGNALEVGVANGSIQIADQTSVPEPGTLLLLGTGVAVAAFRRRKQKHQ